MARMAGSRASRSAFTLLQLGVSERVEVKVAQQVTP
jgi:hypothetical protein